MMNDKKRQEVYNILMTPIKVTACSNGKPSINMYNSVIETTQTYWRDKKKPQMLDEDMSDFSIGFYSIVYKNMLDGNPVLKADDNLYDDNFAGDTMNSFNTIANLVTEAGHTKKERTPMEIWPIWLQKYYSSYHCLANFWLIPMKIGRTSRKLNIYDSIDFFIKGMDMTYDTLLNYYADKNKIKQIEECKVYDKFKELHFIQEWDIMSIEDVENKYKKYGKDNNTKNKSAKFLIDQAIERIKNRANLIAASSTAVDLYTYFCKYNLIEPEEEYLEENEYPIDMDKYLFSYECPKCNRIVKNENNYSIPAVCDECSIRD